MRQYFIVYRFVSERKRQIVSEQTRFLGTVFLCGEFKLENIFSAVNFSGNFYLRKLVFADRWKNRKIRTRKNPVPHGTPGRWEGLQYFTGEHPNFQNTNHLRCFLVALIVKLWYLSSELFVSKLCRFNPNSLDHGWFRIVSLYSRSKVYRGKLRPPSYIV